jgi:putative restriction endonuclease
MPVRKWTRDELVVAFNLYCRTPFGRIHNRNTEIIELAKAIGRSPSAVSWKLANFSRLDPSVTGRNLTGARHGSELDHKVWNEFNQDWDNLAFESEKLKAKLLNRPLATPEQSVFPDGATRATTVMARVNQGFFRAAILAAYESSCCITGIKVPELLRASHIVPWSVDTKNRTNPRNGLCLNALHDQAFDCGFITLDDQLKVKVSPLLEQGKDPALDELIFRYEGHQIQQPKQFDPDRTFVTYHRENIFRARGGHREQQLHR